MPGSAPNPFPTDALDANRRGELTPLQFARLRGLEGYRRKSALHGAFLLVVAALLIGFFASPSMSVPLRVLVTSGCLAIAAFLVIRFLGGADGLARDLRRPRVQCVEGAIGKKHVPAEHGEGLHFLEVGDRRFSVAPLTYQAAPDAGHVRIYFLPLSRKVVNLERLPGAAVSPDVTVQSVMRTLGTSIGSSDQRTRNEARATLAEMGDAMKAAFGAPAAPLSAPPDAQALASTILGTWSNGMITVTFYADGRASTRMLGVDRAGRWSVESDGRLRADVAGRQLSAEARVDGDRLIIAAEGRALTLMRQASSPTAG